MRRFIRTLQVNKTSNTMNKQVIKVKCLSVQPAMAYAIPYLGKDIENRTWRTNYTGWLYIHASKSKSNYEEHKQWITNIGLCCPRFRLLPQGKIICRVWLDTVPLQKSGVDESSQWGMPDCFWWPLSKVELIKPISLKGTLGLFNVNLPESLH